MIIDRKYLVAHTPNIVLKKPSLFNLPTVDLIAENIREFARQNQQE
jgi:hypothetical protein